MVDAALRDVDGSVRLEELGPHLPRAWPESLSRRDEQLRAARDLMLDAVEARPGWAYHRFLLGRVVYAAARGSRNTNPVGRTELWAVPLRRAAEAAPGAAMWATLGGAYLESWSGLPPAMRAEAPAVLKRAFLDPGFVSRTFLSAATALGREEAIRLLPDLSRPLRAAVEALSRGGDVAGAAVLFGRLERAERKQRAVDLWKIEERDRLGDIEDLRAACSGWVSEHPISDFDHPPGRALVARILELWPNDKTGDWRTDPRGELVRFFLNGRERDVKGEAMDRAVEALSGVPQAVRARVKLLAADPHRAQALTGESETEDSFEWTPFFVELAGFELKRGHAREARMALERLAPDAHEECDLLLARREVARALGDGLELDAVSQRLESLSASFYPQGAWSADGTLSLCVDPEQSASRFLTVELVTQSPALVSYGWDGGRLGALLVRGNGVVRVPLTGLIGRRTFSIRALIGGPARPVAVFLGSDPVGLKTPAIRLRTRPFDPSSGPGFRPVPEARILDLRPLSLCYAPRPLNQHLAGQRGLVEQERGRSSAMPLLKAGVDLFPPNLFLLELSETDFPWWVAHVRSRQEKGLARYLLSLKIPFYLPQREHRTGRAGRTFVSYLPLFPGYVFFRGSGVHRHATFRSNLVVRILNVPDQGLLNRELAQLRALQQSGASLVPCPDIAPGDAVRIVEGPFKGYTGVVVRGAARPRLVVSVSMLRRAVAVEFERDVLAPVMSSPRPREKARIAAYH